MRNAIGACVLGVVLGLAGRAAADAMPGCPEGQHLEHNPVSPESRHHAGGHCVENEDSGCSAAGGAGGALAGVALVGLLAWYRRRP